MHPRISKGGDLPPEFSDPKKRGVDSINVAEGEGRLTSGERMQFLGHARGSLYELETQLLIAQRAGYSVSAKAIDLLHEVNRFLNGYMAYLHKKE